MSYKKKEIIENIQPDLFNNNFNPNPYWSSSLFNEVYLKNDVPRKYASLWENDEIGGFYNFYQGFVELCKKKKKEKFYSWNEVDTITNWIRPVMALLGWEDPNSPNDNYVVDNESFTILEDGKNKVYRPDLLYFDDPEHKQYMQNEKKAKNKLREAHHETFGPKIMLEAKYWDRLEEYRLGNKAKKSRNNGKKDETTRSLTPDDQCLKYMSILKHDFGILSDGKTWRLFHSELSSGSMKRCFEFDLGNLAEHTYELDKGNNFNTFMEQAKYFYYFFSKESLVQTDTTVPFVYQVLDYSKKYASNIEEDLRKRFVVAMGHVCNAIAEEVYKESNEAPLELIRNVAESHLFNILFMKSCETRKVLPLNAPDYLKLSLTEIVDTLDFVKFDPVTKDLDHYLKFFQRAFNSNKFDFDGYEIFDRLMRLYRIVHDGASSKDDFGFEIQGFKESVFSKEEWRFARKYKVNNRAMLHALFNLMFIKSDIPGRQYQQIPYNYFTPRQLGSIYESFLEFKLEQAEYDMVFHAGQWKKANIHSKKVQSLKLADHHVINEGDLFFTPDNEDRKMTGAFYTPDNIVELMVEKTMKKYVESLSSEELLELRICDPAMGSGHFLSGALDFLSKSYREKLAEETMDDINISNEEVNRLILDRCLFGVDINDRAVKLAKMSMWLMSSFPGKKLERLDDQLLCGNSLISFNWEKEFKKVFSSGGFDFIIGNPPYISWYSKQAQKLEKKDEIFLRSNYEFLDGVKGKPRINSVMFFLEKSMDILKEEGQLSFIVDLNIHDNPFIHIRKFMTSNYNFEFIVNDIKAFEGVGSGQSIISFSKDFDEDNSTSFYSWKMIEKRIRVEQKDLLKNKASWQLEVSDDFIKEMEKGATLLGDEVIISTGVAVNASKEGKEVFLLDKRKKGTYPICIGGKSLTRAFDCDVEGTYLLYDKSIEKRANDKFDKEYFEKKGSHQRPFNIRDIAEFNRPKIFVRQSDVRVTGALVEDLWFCNYSLFNLYDENNDVDKLKYILALLNSKLISYYSIQKNIVLMREGKTPQLRSGQRGPKGIKHIPIRIADVMTKKKLIKLVDKVIGCDNDSVRTSLYEEIDSIVYSIYEIDEESISKVESELPTGKFYRLGDSEELEAA